MEYFYSKKKKKKKLGKKERKSPWSEAKDPELINLKPFTKAFFCIRFCVKRIIKY